ncbi:MAG: hypothetical protein JNN17_05970 [Verrucomicrobiaceae bacterium]|nr:hypothetical protein [Verrucomicrobiaceae bacterium]
MKRKDLINKALFGNEAGEDEDVERLTSYFVEKADFEAFYDHKVRLQIVKSRKGVGKSALLSRTAEDKRVTSPNDLVLYLKGADLAATQEIEDKTSNGLINGWQQRICSRINHEIGKLLNFAFSDDAIALVESAELAGLKSRNLWGALIDRIKLKANPIETKKLESTNPQALLERFTKRDPKTIWLLVDDIDATFKNTPEGCLALSTFFSACRYLSQSVEGLRIRLSVRTDVWTILAQEDEALDKCEQYLFDLSWSNSEAEQILVRKIVTFFRNAYPDDPRFQTMDPSRDSQAILSLVFTRKFSWGKKSYPPDRPIYILSNGRPRWAAHLCKLAAKEAHDLSATHIGIGHVNAALQKYGEVRLSDLYKEHKHQCPSLQTLLESFARGPSQFTTNDLLTRITDRIIRGHGMIEIDGVKSGGGSISIAHFLYRIGFLCARDDSKPGALSFVRYEDRPNLLSTTQNLDDGLIWEIHPSYRKVLHIVRH